LKDMSVLLIGIDTNIIIRLLTRDHEGQFALARSVVAGASQEKPLCVNIVTMTESLWVLEQRLKMPPMDARSLIGNFLEAPEIVVPSNMPFAGWQSALSSEHPGWTDVVVAGINAELGCVHTLTFDKRAAKSVPGMELLA
jgi:predicted nucleic-acid-binding protein